MEVPRVDGHRGWINYLAVDPQHQGAGVGRLLMEQAEQHLEQAGCPKINLQIRVGNSAEIEFYERLTFTVDDVVSMGKRLIDDATPDRQRSLPKAHRATRERHVGERSPAPERLNDRPLGLGDRGGH